MKLSQRVKIKAQFEEVKRLAKDHRKASVKMDELIEENWSAHYSDMDLDKIIDTLDYGTGSLSFVEFENWMNSKCKPIKR